MRAIALVVTGAALALVVGFLLFVEDVVEAAPPEDPRAEGIVVLTGGSARIDGALRLLAEGRATRLLISGVNPQVGPEALAGAVEDGRLDTLLACCVDLGHEAVDTTGNAAETRNWAQGRGFRSLIVVTSAYHMPRSLVELADAMPGVALVPYPVSNPDLRLGDWWKNPETFELLAREYGKYLLTEARRVVAAPSGQAAVAGT